MSERLQGSELIVDPLRVTKLRKDNGYTQRALALKVGVSERHIQRWESKKGFSINPSNLQKLAAVLGTTEDYLVGAVDVVGANDVTLAYHKKLILDDFDEMTATQREFILNMCDDILKYRKLEV